MTAILSIASLSSVMTSSSFGPTARMCLPFEETRLPIMPLKFPSRLTKSSARRISAKTIQPRPLRGGKDAGATITGGGGFSGGGGGGGGVESSIICRQSIPNRPGGQEVYHHCADSGEIKDKAWLIEKNPA